MFLECTVNILQKEYLFTTYVMEVHQCSYSILSIPSYFIIYYNTACINQSLRTTGILQGKWPKTQKMSSLP